MPGRPLLALAAAAACLVWAADAGGAVTPTGALSQLGGRGGCVYDPAGGSAQGLPVNLLQRCGAAAALDGAFDAAMSADGRHLYVASFLADSLTVFMRDVRSGRLRQLPGLDGCLVDDPFEWPCAEATALDGPGGVALSPDGRNLYVASFASHSVSAYRRDRSTGVLRQLDGPAACTSVADIPLPCADGTALGGVTSIAVSPDGRHVYAAAALSSALAVFARDAGSGALRQLDGEAGCVRAALDEPLEEDVCASARGLEGVGAVAVSRDGRNVYAAALDSAAVTVFARDRLTGRLTQLPGAAGCLSQDDLELDRTCGAARALEGAFGLAVSADGRNVYVSTGLDRRGETVAASFARSGVAVFARNRTTGRLRQLRGTAGCVSQGSTADRCARGRALEGAQAVSLSPDGRNAYVAATGSNAVSIFARDVRTGAVRQLAGRAGCVSETGTRGACRDGTGLWGVSAVAVSPDGRHAYAPGFFSSAVAVFARTLPLRRGGR